MTASLQGDTLRAAARSLRACYPSLPRPVLDHLRQLADRADVEHTAREADAAAARKRHLDMLDTRGRWARRTQGNTGPGVPGRGHITHPHHRDAVDDAEGLCGVALRGRLDWAHRIADTVAAPPGWSGCPRCLAAAKSVRFASGSDSRGVSQATAALRAVVETSAA